LYWDSQGDLATGAAAKQTELAKKGTEPEQDE
jgi:hypothetical protein